MKNWTGSATGRMRRVAGALLLGTMMSGTALPALADNLTVSGITIGSTEAYKVDIPSIEVVDGNIDDASIRSLFSTDPTAGLAALAKLNATSLTIPAISITIVGPDATGAAQTVVLTVNNLKLDSVVNGVAKSATIDSVTMPPSGPESVAVNIGKIVYNDFDMGAMLGVYGIVGGGASDGTMRTIMSSTSFEGGSVSSTMFNCTIGSAESGKSEARSLRYSLDQIMKISTELTEAEKAGTPPSPEAMTTIVKFYADILTAVRADPQVFSGFNCAGTSPDGMKVAMGSGALTIGEYSPGTYPSISLDALRVDVEGLGFLNLGNFTWKPMNFQAAVDLVNAAPVIDLDWLTVNARKLIPAFDGLSVADLSMDVPDPESAGNRIAASLGGLDITLGKYINGIPSDISIAIDALETAMPPSPDGPGAMLIAMGIDKLRASSGAKLHWDEGAQNLVVDDLSFDSPDLGLVKVSGVFGNATADLFADNPDQAMAASMMMTVKSLKLELEDRGLGPILFSMSAAQAGQPEESLRMMIAGSAQGTMLQLLPNSEATIRAVQAIGQFFGGASQLSLSLDSIDPAGVPIGVLAQAEEGPGVLQGLFTMDGTAGGEPVAATGGAMSVTGEEDEGDEEDLEQQKLELKTPAN